jgi:hypothetical protein
MATTVEGEQVRRPRALEENHLNGHCSFDDLFDPA